MYIKEPDVFRANISNKLNKIIKKKKTSLNLEKGIFNWAVQEAKKKNVIRKWSNSNFVLIYTDKFKSIYFNLNSKSHVKNVTLLARLKKKEFQAHKLAFMSHQEMFPEMWRPLIEKKHARDKSAVEVNLSAATDQFHCFKCHKKQCTFYEMQTRSADEPMTTFINCLNCGNHWKQ
jgi:transcription elongation factor S-II